MRKRAALLLAAVMLCGCKAETSEAAERITSETEPETSSSEETAETDLPESSLESSRAETREVPDHGNCRADSYSAHL